MHTETEKITRKRALSNNKKKSKATTRLSSGLVAAYNIQPGNGVGLF